MKSRIRRFWISVSLATSSLAFPLSSSLWSHDLPIRWTSGANSTPSWNQLLDDCLDKSQFAGPRSLMDSEAALRRGTEDWASSCPAEWTQALSCGATRAVPPLDTDMLARNPLSRFSKEMTCWVNEWQDFHQTTITPSSDTSFTFAALPDEGQPPAPGFALGQGEITWRQAAEELASDTCAFDAEYQARQAAADLLAAEMARAAQIAANEARVAQALRDAESIERVSTQDAIPGGSPVGRLVATKLAEPSRCGGHVNEIISQSCFPNRFAPGIVDEYLAYDLNDIDSHWLGGLGKSWKLRSALSNSRSFTAVKPEVTAQDFVADYVAPESFVAPDSTASEFDSEFDADNESMALGSPVVSDTELLNSYLDQLIDQAQQSTLAILENARQASMPVGQALTDAPEVLPELVPSINQQLAMACDWVEYQQCLVSAELCGFEHAFNLGQYIGTGSMQAASSSMNAYIAMGEYLEAKPELVVVYEDSDGSQMVVPSSIARAWNRPEVEHTAVNSDIDRSSQADLIDINSLRDEVIAFVADQLDSIGMACLQTSDQLINWSKVARHKDVDVR